MDTTYGTLDIYTATSSDGVLAQKASAGGVEIERQLLHKKYVETMPVGNKPQMVTGLG
jgi:hypothetical protein